MPTFKVDRSKCRKDGICGKICPMLIIRDDAEGYPEAVESRLPSCINCGHCLAFCPHGAARLEDSGLPPDSELPRIDRARMPAADQVGLLMRSRRSIRTFAERPVPREVIEAILRDCDWAPTAKNSRAGRWLILNSAERIREVNERIAEACNFLAAKDPASQRAELYRRLLASWRRGFDPFLRGCRQLAVFIAPKGDLDLSDSAIALTYFELAAQARGVGCCWAGYFTTCSRAYPPLAEYLGLKESEKVGGGQMFGYPGIRPSLIPARPPLPIDWRE